MKKLLLGACIVLLLTQCKKDDLTDTAQAAELTVPAFTQTGANTFGTYVDGKPWANFGSQWLGGLYSGLLSHNEPNAVTAYPGVNSKGDSVYTIRAELTVTKKGNVIRDETMYLQLPIGQNLQGTRKLVTSDYMVGYRLENQSYYSLVSSPVIATVYQDTLISGKHIISGKFQGTLFGYTNPGVPLTNSVQLTGGVFDVVVTN
ncbi:MAG: hypothetical protein EOP45_03385 [Sphingobacteriaceae bacterium]|nr:MAG: hypothetical protein EOP45_03385 [Sphingobacteriaceae bacterium]